MILRGGRGEFDAPVLEDVAADIPQIGGLRRKGSVAGKLRVNRDGVERLVAGDEVFFSATGVTDGDLLDGVLFEGPEGARTESLVMGSRSGTVRRVSARHDRRELREITSDRLG